MNTTMTKSQAQEMEFHSHFESCPDGLQSKLMRGIKSLSRFTENELKWMLVEADDYEELFKSNAEHYQSDGDIKEARTARTHARSMANLADKIKSTL